MQHTECAVHFAFGRAGHCDDAVAARKTQPRTAFDSHHIGSDALLGQRGSRFFLQCAELGSKSLVERADETDFADRFYRRKADAISGQDACQRVDQHGFHTQCIGYAAGVLTASATKAGQCIGCHIVPASHADLADRIGHAVDGDGEEAFCNLFERALLRQRGGDFGKPRARCIAIKRLVSTGAEDAGKECRIDPAEEEVAVGHRQRAVLAIASRARIGACAFGADAESPGVVVADRPATCRDGVDLHHRGRHAHAGHHAVSGEFVVARIVRHVGAGAAHIETDQAVVSQRFACRDHAHDAASRTRKDRILAAEGADFGQPAVRLHEAQALGFGKAGLQRVGIAPQDGREIGIDHAGIAARDEPDQRCNFVADADLRETRVACEHGQSHLVIAILPPMHQYDCQRIEPVLAQPGERRTCVGLVERLQHRPIGADSLIDLDHLCGQLFGQDDMPCEDIGPRLVADPQRVAESPRNRQSQPFAFAFEQRIGGHGGADAQLRHRTRTVLRHQAPYRFAGGIVVMAGVLRQQLVGHQLPVGRHCHDIGEGPAAIDREAPCALVCLVAHVRRHSHAFAGNSNCLRRTGARSLRNSPKGDVNFCAVGRCRRAEGSARTTRGITMSQTAVAGQGAPVVQAIDTPWARGTVAAVSNP